ncbi:DUF4050 domain-containing protein [Aspergillus clavatus NRRL 1]|uniref:Gag1-like clamp domain-containing protein n=1 Tax=Aspergillus clavatus (strain ATCC 1007 / CBS 513.65 / DSM 816 / NCTC 3887 / NRRL 1 / QM 1276 / 107) TaxID=344612 RepID=A1C6X1_ASPCL|nr:uncharacterized protein ACLA_071750 [Aspergillus clavatus NRRL 1]EAW14142.1 conserved hypothetical protein [Aspergillus clavatus NRRL 1]
MSGEARDAAIRDAKRHVADVVRNDWTFQPSCPASGAAALPHQPWLGWRLREYDSSGSELEPQLSPTEVGSPLSEDGGDSEERARERRRLRRRLAEEEEMRWNPGLRTWVERRDAWTGARSAEEVRALERGEDGDEGLGLGLKSRSRSRSGSGSGSMSGSMSNLGSGSGSPGLAARTEASLAIAEGESHLGKGEAEQSQTLDDGAKESTETTLTVPKPSHEESQESAPATADANANTNTTTTTTTTPTAVTPTLPPSQVRDPLIPLAPSLIPLSNPVRASITPTMYPSIYSKVVVQGLTPTVPINLADLVKAMVQGWKSDGQWPPKPTSIVLQDDSIVHKPASAAAALDNNNKQAQASPESKKRSSVASAVKKVFQFSGFHPHPFHRRGSSHGNHGGHPELHDGHAKDAAPAASSPPGGAGYFK